MVATENFVGRPVLRKEDAKLLTGQATFIDNQSMAGMVWAALVRPPHVHATIDSIDTSGAASMPGVIGVYTAADLEDAFPASLPMVWPITEEIKIPTHWPLTKDKIRFAGDAVAVVVAESREQAEDAAEVVMVSASDLPAVIDLEEASRDEVVLHEDLGTNVVVHWVHGGGGDQSVFDSAPVILQERYTQPRLIPNAIEPRGCLAYGIPAAGEFTLVSATQIPHIARVGLSIATGIPQSKLRIIAPDVGGGFGSKLNVYAEEALALALARKIGRPVKWIETRQENYLATIHGRGVLHDCTLAGTDDGDILGMKFVELADMGAYFQLLTPGIPELGGWVYMGPYDTKAYWYEFKGVMTNATPTDAYRGAGRPEATFVIERLVDAYARRIGMDPADVRRKNFLPPSAEAIPSIMGLQIDSANYEPTFDRALELAEYDQMRKEQAARRDRRDVKQLGIGLSSYIEMCGLAPSEILGALRYVAGGWDAAEIECRPNGKIVVRTGTSPHGQGHDTSWSQIVADGLGVTPDDVEVLHGDTAVSRLGMDTYGSAVGERRSRGRRPRARQGAREGTDDRGARARGRRGRPGMGRRSVPGDRRPRQGADDPRTGGVRMARPLAAQGHGTHARGHCGFRSAELHVARWHARVHRRGRHRDRQDRHRAVRGGRRLWKRDQPHDRRRADPRRCRPRHRGGLVRGGDLRRVRQPHDVLDDAVPGPDGGRDPVADPRSHGDPVDDELARRQGHGKRARSRRHRRS